LAFEIKNMVFPYIHNHEKHMLELFFKRFENNSNVFILGPHKF